MFRPDQFVVHALAVGGVFTNCLHLPLETLTARTTFGHGYVCLLGDSLVRKPLLASRRAVGATEILLLHPHEDDGAVTFSPERVSVFRDTTNELRVGDPSLDDVINL